MNNNPSPSRSRQLINDYYTLGEEIANSITHGIGALLSVAGLVVLVLFATWYGGVWELVSFTIYGVTLFLLYLASTLYHSFQRPDIKRVLRIVDHSSIYLLIAGTYTPFLLVAVRNTTGWTMLVTVWGLAVLGIAFKALFIHKFQVVSTLAYVGMGWLCVVAWNEMMANLPLQSVVLLALGGASYTVGVIFYAWHKMPYNHAVWHLFVMGGSACHYFAILPLAGLAV